MAEDKNNGGPLARLWRNWILPIGLAVLIVTALRSTIADWNDVPTGSMLPTIVEGDRIAVNKLAYDLKIPFTGLRLARWSQPQRGDVVTFWKPTDGTRLVKRVVAVPGDTVELRSGVLFVNDIPATYTGTPNGAEPYVETFEGRSHELRYVPSRHLSDTFEPVTVPPDHFFMLGDNRFNSEDSRAFGPVHRDAITGEAFAVAISFDPAGTFMPRWNRFLLALD